MYTLRVYTKMTDLFNTTILCEDCNRKTSKGELLKDGFRLRYWNCENCNKKWFHPLDNQNYEDFQKLKQKEFHVKLRMVGNSYTVSIPREIIDFEEEFDREMNKLINLSLDEPGKISIFLRKRIRKVY